MRNDHYLDMGHRTHTTKLLHAAGKRTHNRPRIQPLHSPADPVKATLHALEKINDIVSDGCLTRPNNLTQDEIHAYALALLRMRECAGLAGMDRLMNACDALAVSVSNLIDDPSSASRATCEALTRFVVYARDMIRMSESEPSGLVMMKAG